MSASAEKLREGAWRRIFSEEDLVRLRDVIYPSLPSYRKEDCSIAPCDIAELCRQLNWERTPEQIAAYEEYWSTHYEGRTPYTVLSPILATCHESGPWMREYIKACDKNGDGFIQKEEFEQYFKIFELHFPDWKVTYADFVKEADINLDGKVSIDEAVAWHEKHEQEAMAG